MEHIPAQRIESNLPMNIEGKEGDDYREHVSDLKAQFYSISQIPDNDPNYSKALSNIEEALVRLRNEVSEGKAPSPWGPITAKQPGKNFWMPGQDPFIAFNFEFRIQDAERAKQWWKAEEAIAGMQLIIEEIKKSMALNQASTPDRESGS